MREHKCLLCLGSNDNDEKHILSAQIELKKKFPKIKFGILMKTKPIGDNFHTSFYNQLAVFYTSIPAEEVRKFFKVIEKQEGRTIIDKAANRVKLDIDLLKYGRKVLKKEDMKRDYIIIGIKDFKKTLGKTK
ncbi:MAG: 2-amino-4-hydroxy-6-hydroxymethyldihydropteridine diphosphokinase [Phocaeicola sp.]|uniref:2-amino-4-hydroxy-6- hydroxymethyldihydropteridine diphosphokinase n=1 Tax=Phocaeicola TaxID=909656 RepID=UPI00234EE484|nr:2-amino-4-hydroxy-6-hydroxymethyldihydropteridine diphosphokinase [Phocaeicola oris]MCE2617402.1 2-amino-4-hydroxy-6-hydroxymethyldihydropteridine diphosphokinase [Phocaeicola oris]